ncbi:MAG: 3-oxo-5-alpha-steroid 4-dehydrogenase [Oligoflexia bacterium]|nr:3-oxo-5-alpha-steroid 4-dehydrogenase [Oligoflexia bacterium]MBF0366915.1 3-oxo-5-alpha-steroid 4-dehydrogenase [Oligoflexia bacterium]
MNLFHNVVIFAFTLVFIVAIAACFVASPFGKFSSEKMGFNLNPKWGWFLMELPAVLSFYYFYFKGERALTPVPLFFLFVWSVHYLNRGFIFPYLMRVPKGMKSNFSITVVVMGQLVTLLHGYLNAAYLVSYGDHFDLSWFADPRFLLGIFCYYFGFFLNIHSDAIVRNLRSKEEIEQGDKVYRIPFGGAYRFVSNPSYLGELLAWLGFALATWSPGGLFIFLISLANLLPRAISTHRWYVERFPNYPTHRKILIPYIF